MTYKRDFSALFFSQIYLSIIRTSTAFYNKSEHFRENLPFLMQLFAIAIDLNYKSLRLILQSCK